MKIKRKGSRATGTLKILLCHFAEANSDLLFSFLARTCKPKNPVIATVSLWRCSVIILQYLVDMRSAKSAINLAHKSILGYLGNGSTEGGYAAMGILHHPGSKIFFIGDANGIEQVPQPFTSNLVKWLFK